MLLVQSQVINISILQSKCRLVLHPLPNISILQSISQLALNPLSVTIFPASIPTFEWCSRNECKVVESGKGIWESEVPENCLASKGTGARRFSRQNIGVVVHWRCNYSRTSLYGLNRRLENFTE